VRSGGIAPPILASALYGGEYCLGVLEQRIISSEHVTNIPQSKVDGVASIVQALGHTHQLYQPRMEGCLFAEVNDLTVCNPILSPPYSWPLERGVPVF
jgi:hypothetical protein